MATISEQELTKRRTEEYEMQLFGLHSRSVFEAIKQKIEENVDTRCQMIHSAIEKKYSPDEKERRTLKSNITDLKETYHCSMQPHLALIKNVVNKFISVPDNVLLEEDKCQATQYSDEDIRNMHKTLDDLHQQAKSVTMFNAALQEELEEAEKMGESVELAKKLCNVTERALTARKLSGTELRAIEKSKALKESLDALKPQTKKDIYNPRLDESELEQIFSD